MCDEFQEVVLKVRIKMPAEMYVGDLKAYIRDAISSWSGQFHPEDPLFGWFHDDKKKRLIVTTMRKKYVRSR